MDSTTILRVKEVSKTFPNGQQHEKVLSNVSLQVQKGEIISILGKSGCGKSTLLNIIGGFEQAEEGQVLFHDKVVTQPHRRCVMLFQHYGLLPWRSVLKNVELGLENTSLTAEKRRSRALEYIKLVGLEDKVHYFAHQLSGGMQQRVAIARALAVKPELILMDEPFAALDTFNRYYLQDELLKLQQREKTTILFVTHDIDEAVYLSDRIIILKEKPGAIKAEINIRLGKPRDRSNEDFQYFRKRIFNEFDFNQPVQRPEFTI